LIARASSLPNTRRSQDPCQRRHRADRNHHHGPQLYRHAVFEVFQIAGEVGTDLFDFDLKFFYISLKIGDVSFRGQVLFDQFRPGMRQGLGLLLGEPGLLQAFGELKGIEGS